MENEALKQNLQWDTASVWNYANETSHRDTRL